MYARGGPQRIEYLLPTHAFTSVLGKSVGARRQGRVPKPYSSFGSLPFPLHPPLYYICIKPCFCFIIFVENHFSIQYSLKLARVAAAMATTVETEQVKVLSLWVSPFGLRVLIALEEKGLQYEYQEEDLSNKSQLLLQMNPIYKKVPVLIHNGKPLCESLLILHFIDETWPHKPLLPSDPYARAQARFWADFVDKKVYDSGSRLLKSKGEALEEAKRDVLGSLELLEGALRDLSGGEGGYFGGTEFGFMDIALIPFMGWFDAYERIGNFKIPLETQFPLLKAWIQKCLERESVKKVLPTPERLLEYAVQLRKKFGAD